MKMSVEKHGITLLLQCERQSFCQLVRAGSRFHAAADAAAFIDYALRRFVFDEVADALQIAVAAADKFQIVDTVLVVKAEVYLLRAGS